MKLALLMIWVFQLPSRDRYNCVSIRRFLVYKKRHLASGSHRYQLIQNVYMPQAQLSNVNQYRNLTIGVSFVNNAELESDIVDHVFVGSQYNYVLLSSHVYYSDLLYCSFCLCCTLQKSIFNTMADNYNHKK